VTPGADTSADERPAVLHLDDWSLTDNGNHIRDFGVFKMLAFKHVDGTWGWSINARSNFAAGETFQSAFKAKSHAYETMIALLREIEAEAAR
jgi:hypothetical protein